MDAKKSMFSIFEFISFLGISRVRKVRFLGYFWKITENGHFGTKMIPETPRKLTNSKIGKHTFFCILSPHLLGQFPWKLVIQTKSLSNLKVFAEARILRSDAILT